MTNNKEKYITINVNEEIKNLCPDLEEEQVITLSEIICLLYTSPSPRD